MRPPMKPLKALDDALADLLAQATPLPGTDTVTTFDADGRVLAQDCVSALQVPPQDNSAMTATPCAAPMWRRQGWCWPCRSAFLRAVRATRCSLARPHASSPARPCLQAPMRS